MAEKLLQLNSNHFQRTSSSSSWLALRPSEIAATAVLYTTKRRSITTNAPTPSPKYPELHLASVVGRSRCAHNGPCLPLVVVCALSRRRAACGFSHYTRTCQYSALIYQSSSLHTFFAASSAMAFSSISCRSRRSFTALLRL